MNPLDDVDFQSRMQGIEKLIRELESVADPRVRRFPVVGAITPGHPRRGVEKAVGPGFRLRRTR